MVISIFRRSRVWAGSNICVIDHIITILADLLFTICTAKLKSMPENTGFGNVHITLRKQTQHIQTSGLEKHLSMFEPLKKGRIVCIAANHTKTHGT